MLRISEHFYSIQGEGASVGAPAYFIRLQGCNLMCGGSKGKLVQEGKATWWCDSEKIWKQGNKFVNEDLVDCFKDQNLLNRILTGQIHLVWTGGEPTMACHVSGILSFIQYINELYPQNFLYNEIETNGTLVVPDYFYFDKLVKDGCGYKFEREAVIDQINCSPKLANSGIDRDIRINPEAIEQIKRHENGWFKFVISTEEDISEIQNEWIIPFELDPSKIIIMPGVDNRDDLAERTRFLFEMTKKYGYRGVTRCHILAWDRTCGV